jgi:hypothetical protein
MYGNNPRDNREILSLAKQIGLIPPSPSISRGLGDQVAGRFLLVVTLLNRRIDCILLRTNLVKFA